MGEEEDILISDSVFVLGGTKNNKKVTRSSNINDDSNQVVRLNPELR